jgi:hypothetical protein
MICRLIVSCRSAGTGGSLSLFFTGSGFPDVVFVEKPDAHVVAAVVMIEIVDEGPFTAVLKEYPYKAEPPG